MISDCLVVAFGRVTRDPLRLTWNGKVNCPPVGAHAHALPTDSSTTEFYSRFLVSKQMNFLDVKLVLCILWRGKKFCALPQIYEFTVCELVNL
jgi:hypothetical protein